MVKGHVEDEFPSAKQMSEQLLTFPESPRRVGNFVITCELENVEVGETDDFLNYLQDVSNDCGLKENDSKFYPRAFTDVDLMDKCFDDKDKFHEIFNMEVGDDEALELENLSPGEVNVANSQQRSGPEGSPAFPTNSASQGFVPTGNESGELFAPVKTLNFSEIDDTVQIESSFQANGSRFVSTPDQKGTGGLHSQSQHRGGSEIDNPIYDMQHSSGDGGTTEQDSVYNSHPHMLQRQDSNDSEELSPPFKELCVDTSEVDSVRFGLGTGAFEPSAIGLNKEFLENFTRKPNPNLGDDIFSPLVNRKIACSDSDEDRSQTPPLHGSQHNSPFVEKSKRFAPSGQEIRSQTSTYCGTGASSQFHISPRNTSPRNVTGNHFYNGSPRGGSPVTTSNGAFYSVSQKNGSQQNNMTNVAMSHCAEQSQQFLNMPAAMFEQRYLQRTHVSVTLPQPSYDAVDYSQIRFSSGNQEDNLHDSLEEHELKEDHHQKGVEIKGFSSNPKRETVMNKMKGQGQEISETGSRREVTGVSHFSHESKPDFHDSSESINSNDTSKSAKGAAGPRAPTSGGNQPSVNSRPVQSSNVSKSSAVTFRPSANEGLQKGKVCPKFGVSKGAPANAAGKDLKRNDNVDMKKSSVRTIPGATRLQASVANEGKHSLRKTANDGEKVTKSRPESDLQKRSRIPNQVSRVRSSVEQNQIKTVQSKSEHTVTGFKVKSMTEIGHPTQRNVPAGQAEYVHSRLPGSSTGTPEHDGKDIPVSTQVQQTSPYSMEMRAIQNYNQKVDEANLDIQGMEEVRHQLHSMLQMSHTSLPQGDRSQYEHSDIIAGHDPFFQDMNPFGRPEGQWNILRKSHDDTVDMFENFPSFSSQMATDSGNVSRSDMSLQAENVRLRDMLEKERYRRTHCEQYIQQLNVKLLESQQQLAVAVSTDKKKDIMIEQLDKQLATVVDGWKKRDGENTELINKLKRDRQVAEDSLQQQQQMMASFERDMSEAVEVLRAEKEKSAEIVDSLKAEVLEKERERNHFEDLVEAEREKGNLLQQECDHIRESREQTDKKNEQLQRKLHREQDDWFKREQELLEKIEEVSEKNMKILQEERAKNEEQGKLAEEVVEQLQLAQTNSKKLELELDAALREKESMKVEIGIMEAKFENAQKKLEADLHSQMEKEIAAQIGDVQRRMEKEEEEVREQHRHQIIELNQRHGKDLEKQMAMFREEVGKKEDEFRKQLQELEQRLLEYRNENSALKMSKQKLESQRMEILTKLQYGLQSQWNEALTLLSTTPQRRNFPGQIAEDVPNGSVVQTSPQRSGHSVTSLNLSLQNPASRTAVSSPGKDSVVSHSTAKSNDGDEHFSDHVAAAHLKEFQDYIDSISQNPDWLTTMIGLGSQTTSGSVPRSQIAQSLPPPTDIPAMLSSHFHSLQQNRPQTVAQNQNEAVPNIFNGQSSDRADITNQKLHSRTGGNIDQSGVVFQTIGQPESSFVSHSSQMGKPESFVNESFHSSWEVGAGVPTAVAIRPPQQHASQETGPNSVPSQGYFQGGQSFSPPTKQTAHTEQDESMEEITPVPDDSFRLNEDYSHLSERVNQHESRQTELHHYVQMLLNRPPGSPHHQDVNSDEGDSVYSQDQTEELDLNDTAQAAQLQRELDRIQQLRDKQSKGVSRDGAGSHNVSTRDKLGMQDGGAEQDEGSKILQPSQMAEIAKLLSHFKGSHSEQGADSQAENSQITELIDILRSAHSRNPSPTKGVKGKAHGDDRRPKGLRNSPKSVGSAHPDRMKELAKVKRNLHFQNGKTVETAQSKDVNTGAKQGQPKKLERKVAGGGGGGGKPGQGKAPAWK